MEKEIKEKDYILIKLQSYDVKILDESVKAIVEEVKKTGAVISGPILLPTKRRLYTLLRSPHTDKKSREQFELCIHRRLIKIISPTPQTIEALYNKVTLPAGVDVKIK
ncbi:MAG: 30S ribosomal protein S10 [Caldiserica bacterium]|mgnify:CR=1 FL=1|nr:MAG: 30S ribosomal protein S10 [Caldisericota bacterium]